MVLLSFGKRKSETRDGLSENECEELLNPGSPLMKGALHSNNPLASCPDSPLQIKATLGPAFITKRNAKHYTRDNLFTLSVFDKLFLFLLQPFLVMSNIIRKASKFTVRGLIDFSFVKEHAAIPSIPEPADNLVT